MDIKKVADDFSVSAQISAGDVAAIGQLGFRAIICNRPDDEATDQPSFAEIETAAKRADIAAAYIPVTPGAITEEIVAAFGDAIRSLPHPVLAYCRSGARSSMLWSMLQD